MRKYDKISENYRFLCQKCILCVIYMQKYNHLLYIAHAVY